ncbi:HAMP domain-containing sensor histidine kinase [Mycolicibacterium aromaticivorans]|uniref:HAMP domain-containing sensor histidine kinase n=1 Tax=Mycolicibacterium aromaticivorans TaxID=318425 RepID=UPI00045384BD|nr:HAMP domain-containing sensor histidine kinase [Mycolicibacterium aromaticivorans]
MSLSRRVTLATLLVFVVVLAAVVGIVYSAMSVVVDRSVGAILTEHAQFAKQLAAHDTPPQQLVSRLQSASVRTRLELGDGRVFGALDDRPLRDSTARTRTITLTAPHSAVNGARLTLQVDAPLMAQVRSRVIQILLIVAMVAVVVVLIIVPLTARIALAPLDRLVGLARSITAGRRGERLQLDRGSELGRAAEAFDEMLDALEGAEKRATDSELALRQFIGDAAHELRTPIAGIAAATEAVLAQPDDNPDPHRHRLLLALGREARHAGRLVEDLLDVARIDTGLRLACEPTDVRQICLQQAERAAISLRVPVLVDGPSAVAWADPARIGQVMANLFNNACAVTPPGKAVHTLISGLGDIITVVVYDEGPGVPAVDRERIFERLVRLDGGRNPSGGSGLGLTIARGIARAHGGDLTCRRPDPGVAGAAFELTLPAYSAATSGAG